MDTSFYNLLFDTRTKAFSITNFNKLKKLPSFIFFFRIFYFVYPFRAVHYWLKLNYSKYVVP